LNFSLEGKVALVTGGGTGIGQATSLELAKAGADVAIVSRKLANLQKVAAEIKELGRESLAVSAHLGKMESIPRIVETVVKKFGRIDILVNNAGNCPALNPALVVEERLWDTVMNLNLKGVFFLSQAVARVMMGNGGGKIINVASIDGFKPGHNLLVYDISKGGVIMATKAMAKEWAQYNIRVNAVAPGLVHTPFSDAYDPKDKEEIIKRTPLRRVAQPVEIAGAMIYLASDASSFVTGAVFIMDGGALLS
jgi:NAD(P)-dependent dehydrogenase (short-subunit alcohol dehydrogenase family)